MIMQIQLSCLKRSFLISRNEFFAYMISIRTFKNISRNQMIRFIIFFITEIFLI